MLTRGGLPVYFGTMFGISQLGLISGPLIGGALTEYATWRWCKSRIPASGLNITYGV